MVFLKLLITIILSTLLLVFLGNNYNQEIIIPKQSIRFRIISDDSSKNSDEIKFKIKMQIETELNKILEENDNFLSSKVKIQNNIKSLENKVNIMLKKEKIFESANNVFCSFQGIRCQIAKIILHLHDPADFFLVFIANRNIYQIANL